MSKFTDAIVATLKGYFETGDKPTETQFAEWIQAIQDGIQEHEHTLSGGAGSGTGDAAATVDKIFTLNGWLEAEPEQELVIWNSKIATSGTLKCYRIQASNGGSGKSVRLHVWDNTTASLIYDCTVPDAGRDQIATGNPVFQCNPAHIIYISLINLDEEGWSDVFGYLYAVVE